MIKLVPEGMDTSWLERKEGKIVVRVVVRTDRIVDTFAVMVDDVWAFIAPEHTDGEFRMHGVSVMRYIYISIEPPPSPSAIH